MRYALLSIALVAFLAILSSDAYSTNFAVSIAPTTISATTSTLLNFTIINLNNTYNITQVNITLPNGFSYSSNTGTTVPVSLVSQQQTVWTNLTSTGIVNTTTSTQYFWFNVSSSVISPPTYTFSITATDTSGASATNTTSVTVNDVTAPTYNSNSTTPSSPSTYVLGANYTFNITWNDNINVSNVTFNWNGVNQTATAYATNKYSVTKTDLAAGIYTYQWYANDTSGNSNTTGQLSFNVSQATNTIDMYLNGNLDQSILLANGTTLNVTVVAKVPTTGTIYLFKNNSQIASGGAGTALQCTSSCTQPLAINTGYVFLANATGNTNYTTNSTGISYNVNVIYPAPTYSISASTLSNYGTVASTWTATFADQNDPNGFNVSLIELNYTGTPTNYTMTRNSGTNVSTYSIILPVGTYYWKIYVNNSFGSWNSTSNNSFTIAQATPSLTVSIVPAFQVYNYTQVNASCAASTNEVTVSLYKNFTSVSNPYVASLTSGYYQFDCNNTATKNYTSSATTQFLSVLAYSIYFNFVNPPSPLYVDQNSTNSTAINISNAGTETQTINFVIDSLNSTVWKSSSSNVALAQSANGVFVVTFNSSSLDVGSYPAAFRAYNSNRTVTYNFTLKVMPSNTTKAYINSTLLAYSNQIALLANEINNSKNSGANTTNADNLLAQLESNFNKTQAYVNSGDYFNAYLSLVTTKGLLTATNSEVDKLNQIPVNKFIDMLKIIAPIVAVVIILVYLFLPPGKSSYNLKAGFKYSAENGSLLKKLIKKLSKDKKLKEDLEIKEKGEGEKQ